MKKETLVSIAERSGCSISTVSRVLSGNAAKYRISQRTVARVTEEVKRCNYTPSLLAKGLRTNRTDTIGLLIPNIENSFFAGVAGVVIRESRNYNYKVVVVDTQEDERNEQDGLSALLARRVDGIIAAPCGNDAALFASVQEGGMPLVLIDRYLPDAGIEASIVPVVEAMRAGVPMVLSDTQLNREAAGDAAAYVRPEAAGEVAAALENVLSDANFRREMKARERRRAELFSEYAVARRLIDIYSSL